MRIYGSAEKPACFCLIIWRLRTKHFSSAIRAIPSRPRRRLRITGLFRGNKFFDTIRVNHFGVFAG
jgi:hypothetical protein